MIKTNLVGSGLIELLIANLFTCVICSLATGIILQNLHWYTIHCNFVNQLTDRELLAANLKFDLMQLQGKRTRVTSTKQNGILTLRFEGVIYKIVPKASNGYIVRKFNPSQEISRPLTNSRGNRDEQEFITQLQAIEIIPYSNTIQANSTLLGKPKNIIFKFAFNIKPIQININYALPTT